MPLSSAAVGQRGRHRFRRADLAGGRHICRRHHVNRRVFPQRLRLHDNAAGWFFTTSDGTSLNGTPIAGFDFLSATGTSADIQTPPGSGLTYEVNFGNGSGSEQLYLTFAHALDIGGPDPLMIGASAIDPSTPASGECAGFSCSLSDERLVAGGLAEVAEPTSLTILGVGLLGLGARSRHKRGLAKRDDGGTAELV